MQDSDQLNRLLDLDARHDDLLRQLAELDQRVNEVLRTCQADGPPPAAAFSGALTSEVAILQPKAA